MLANILRRHDLFNKLLTNMPSIFLCHSSRDKVFVRILKSRLSRYKVKVWLDEDEIKAGESLISTITNAISEMDYLGIVLSPNAIKSKWVQEELEFALHKQIDKTDIRVLPILYKKCIIPSFLRGKKYVSFTKWNSKAEFDELKPAVEQLVKGMDIDPRDNERWSGRLMIKICDFREIIASHFAPRTVEIKFFEDLSGLENIKVNNGDRTFQLYDYWSYPSYIDLFNEIFVNSEKPIIDIEIVETLLWSAEERDQFVTSTCKEFRIDEGAFWKFYENQSTKESASKDVKQATNRYEKWINEQYPIGLIRKGDFGSNREY